MSTRIATAPNVGPESISIDSLVDMFERPDRPVDRVRERNLVKEFVAQVLMGEITHSRDITLMISARIAQIDRLVSLQLSVVLHNPAFQSLESTWRGLRYLVNRSGDSVKVRVLNATKRELARDFEASGRYNSALYVKVVDAGLNTLGGEPFSIIAGSYSFGRGAEDLHLLDNCEHAAELANAPFLCAADPGLFGVDSIKDAIGAPNIGKYFEVTEAAQWQGLRRSSRSRHGVCVLPRILLRKPYSRDNGNSQWYEEGVDRGDSSQFLWGSSAWALAAQLGRAFEEGSWCADLGAVEGGNVVTKLPKVFLREDEGDIRQYGPAEAPVSDRAYQQLLDLGIAALCSGGTHARPAFFDVPTLHRALPETDENDEEIPARPAMLREVLIQSRLAQYIKCIVRENYLRFETADECERYLLQWIAGYASADRKSPFREADLTVTKDPHRPEGWFRVEGYVVPHFAYSQAAPTVDFSVGVFLKRSANDGGRSESVRAQFPQVVASVDPLLAASEALARIGSLRQQQILADAEFLEMKAALLSRIQQLSALAAPDPKKSDSAPPAAPVVVPYAALHAQIVDLIADPYRAGKDPRQRAYEALREMDEKRALNPGDSRLLAQLADTALTDTQEELPGRIASLRKVVAKIRGKRDSSPAARAIADTAEHSSSRAAQELATGGQPPHQEKESGPLIWRKLVWPDVEGAFGGGAAATAAFPVLTSSSFPWPLQMAAALGVVVGAGIRSGIAYGESAFQVERA